MADTTVTNASQVGLLGWLRRYPLLSYFVLAYGFTWTWILVFLVALGVPLQTFTNILVIAGPAIAGFFMTYVMEGRAGILHFLRRFILWRVPWFWYLFALLGPLVLLNLGVAVMPGALGTFTPPTLESLQGLPVFFILVLAIGGPLLEEPGWRGFALPRLQKKWGPLVGTLVLGVLWTVWHFPLFLLPVWAEQNGGFTLQTVSIYTVTVIAFTVLFTWLFNHARGSLLLVILFHTGINVLGALLFFQGDATLGGVLAFSVAAILVVIATRGRLGYDAYLRDEAAGLTQMTTEMGREPFVGTWHLVDAFFTRPNGELMRLYGEHPGGMLVYDAQGHMTVHVMRRDRPPLPKGPRTTDDYDAVLRGYTAYFGTYDTDETAGTISHHVSGSLTPEWVGGTQVRYYEFSPNRKRLTLRTPPMVLVGETLSGELIWERAE